VCSRLERERADCGPRQGLTGGLRLLVSLKQDKSGAPIVWRWSMTAECGTFRAHALWRPQPAGFSEGPLG
jgi:hypothetical protein